MNITINEKEKLYNIESKDGYSCLGFEVLMRWGDKLAKELNQPLCSSHPLGSMEAYNHYSNLIEQARSRNIANGWRSNSQLHPKLIGLEGKKVQITLPDGTKEKFKVGKSMGFIPIHLKRINKDPYCDAISDNEEFNLQIL